MSQDNQGLNDVCPLSEAALLLNSKWDLVVIHNLMDQPLRFSELKDKISKGLDTPITSSSLTRILRKLESENLLCRDISAEVGESVEINYELTSSGYALKAAIEELKKWGAQYLLHKEIS